MSNQLKNPIFWGVAAFVIGLGVGVWGLIKEESDNYVGTDTLYAIAIVLIIGGIVGMRVSSKKKRL